MAGSGPCVWVAVAGVVAGAVLHLAYTKLKSPTSSGRKDNHKPKGKGPSEKEEEENSSRDDPTFPAGRLREEFKLVLVLRTDLKMGKGKGAAQCCHATLAAYEQMTPKHRRLWMERGQAKVVVKIDSLEKLQDLRRAAKRAGLPTATVRDAGRTQIAAGETTVLAVGPAPKSLLDQVTGHLKLY